MSENIKTIQTLLDGRADKRLRSQITIMLQPLQKHIEIVSGYPKITFDGKERAMDNAFMSTVFEALFQHSQEQNRTDVSVQFLSDAESFRQQLEELKEARPE
jgi:hypothetical protein